MDSIVDNIDSMDINNLLNEITKKSESSSNVERSLSNIYFSILKISNIMHKNCMKELMDHVLNIANQRAKGEEICQLSSIFLKIWPNRTKVNNFSVRSFFKSVKSSIKGNKEDALLCSFVGCCYLEKIGVKQENYQKAHHYFQMGFNLDPVDETCSFFLGRMYDFGYHVEKNTDTALKYYRISEKRGFRSALNNIGILYEDGDGVKKDTILAFEYFKKSAELGHSVALYNLSLAYQYGTENVKVDLNYARDLMERSAEKNYPDALTRLGLFYLNGIGIQKDEEKAKEYFLKGIEMGNLGGYAGLGKLYLAQNNLQSAIDSFRKGYEANDLDSSYELAKLYEESDKEKSVCIYLQINQFETDGYSLLKVGYLQIKDYENDPSYDRYTTITLFKEAAEKGQELAKRILRDFYRLEGYEPNDQDLLDMLEEDDEDDEDDDF